MVNEKLRKALANMCEELELEEDEQPLLFDDMSYDGAIVGVTYDHRVVYSYEKMVEELMRDQGWEELDAVEWIDYNTLGALPGAECRGGKAPIILMDDVESLVFRYGD